MRDLIGRRSVRVRAHLRQFAARRSSPGTTTARTCSRRAGASASRRRTAAGTELMFSARAEDERASPARRAPSSRESSAPMATFPPTDPVREGFAAGGGVAIDHSRHARRAGCSNVEGLDVRWRVRRPVGGGAAARRRSLAWLGHACASRAALPSVIDSVPQLALRAGGQNTVRGYDFGVAQGDALWAVQLDVSQAEPQGRQVGRHSSTPGRRGLDRNFGSRAIPVGGGRRRLGARWLRSR